MKLNSDDRAYGGDYHEMGFRWSPLRGAVAVKWDSDGRAYGEYCREMGFRWSEFDFTLPLLCRRKLGGRPPVAPTVSVRFLPNRHGRHKRPYFQKKRTPSLPHLTEGHSVLRGRWRRQATDEVPPAKVGGAAMTGFGEVKFVRRDESAFGVMSTELVIAHSPMPSAWAHLIRHGFAVTPSPRGEDSVAHQNFMST